MYSYDCPVPEIEDCKSKMDMLKERIITMQKCQRKQIFDYAKIKNELENKNKILSQRVDSLTNEMNNIPERETEFIKLQASIIRGLRKEINEIKSSYDIIKHDNHKLKKCNELLEDILLCRCKDNTGQ
jgi:archaellum component FlaC